LSWIRWRSPFSDSARIAVDISKAKGESLGNAWFLANTNEQRRESVVKLTIPLTGCLFIMVKCTVIALHVKGSRMSNHACIER
jgi:hypothetical protein